MDTKDKLALFFKKEVNNDKILQHSTCPVTTIIDGRECQNDYGSFFIIEKEYPLNHVHTLYPQGEPEMWDGNVLYYGEAISGEKTSILSERHF